MHCKNIPLWLTGALVTATAPVQAQNLLIPDSDTDQVMLVSGMDGSVLDANFLDVATAAANAGVTTSTPVEAIEVGNEIWVSEQVGDRIWRFGRDGSFIADLGVGELNNVRGMEVVGDTVYVAMGNDSDTIPEGVVRIDVPTLTVVDSFAGRPAADISYFDVKLYNGELLVSNIDSGNDGIERYALDGTFLGFFATSDGVTSFDFPQQINTRANSDNLLVASFSLPSGIFEIRGDGTDLGIVAALDFGPRAGYELGNGEILWTNGTFLRTDSTIIIDGGSFRFIAPTSITLDADSDGDGISDSADNCIAVANADQRDTDSDGLGNVCDADLNQDCVVQVTDLGLLRSVFFSADPTADFNGDGTVNVIDLGVLSAEFFKDYTVDNPSGVTNICSPLR